MIRSLHRKIFCLSLLVLGFIRMDKNVIAQTLPLSSNLINFNSSEGKSLFLKSEVKESYFPLSIHFITQDSPSYCGVASAVMVLNALSIYPNGPSDYGEFHYFTQKNFFDNPKTQAILTAEQVAKKGMTLDQLGSLLQSYPVKAKVYYSQVLSLEEFRKIIVDNLQKNNLYILVNYLRKGIGEETWGHISPLAAYNQQTDRLLILDVSRYKYPPVWVKVEELWKATQTIDTTSHKSRGFVLVNRSF